MNKFDEIWYCEARVKVKFTKKSDSTNSEFVESVKKVVLSYNYDKTIVLGLSVKETETDEVKVGKKVSNSLTSVTLSLEIANVQSSSEEFFNNIIAGTSEHGSIESVSITEFNGLRTRSLGSAGLQSYTKRFEMVRSSTYLIINVFKHLVKTLSDEESVEFEEVNSDD